MRARFRLEHGLALGGAITLAGFVTALVIVIQWINQSFGAARPQQSRDRRLRAVDRRAGRSSSRRSCSASSDCGVARGPDCSAGAPPASSPRQLIEPANYRSLPRLVRVSVRPLRFARSYFLGGGVFPVAVSAANGRSASSRRRCTPTTTSFTVNEVLPRRLPAARGRPRGPRHRLQHRHQPRSTSSRGPRRSASTSTSGSAKRGSACGGISLPSTGAGRCMRRPSAIAMARSRFGRDATGRYGGIRGCDRRSRSRFAAATSTTCCASCSRSRVRIGLRQDRTPRDWRTRQSRRSIGTLLAQLDGLCYETRRTPLKPVARALRDERVGRHLPADRAPLVRARPRPAREAPTPRATRPRPRRSRAPRCGRRRTRCPRVSRRSRRPG